MRFGLFLEELPKTLQILGFQEFNKLIEVLPDLADLIFFSLINLKFH